MVSTYVFDDPGSDAYPCPFFKYLVGALISLFGINAGGGGPGARFALFARNVGTVSRPCESSADQALVADELGPAPAGVSALRFDFRSHFGFKPQYM